MIKKTLLLTVILLLLPNDIHAHTGRREEAMKAALRGVAMKKALRGVVMEAALKGAPQKIARNARKKERFFFTLNQRLRLSRVEKSPIPAAQGIFPFRIPTMR